METKNKILKSQKQNRWVVVTSKGVDKGERGKGGQSYKLQLKIVSSGDVIYNR